MAEYKDFGPGYNETARLASNVSLILTDAQYKPYSTVAKVFQDPFTGVLGNVAWIDTNPER